MGKKIGPNPTDRAKGGVKRSLLTGARGIPVGLVLDGANRHDVKLVDSTLANLSPAAEAVRDAHRAAGGEQGLCLEAGYDAKQVRETLIALGYTAHIQPRDAEIQAKKPVRKPGVGSWNAPTPGLTASGTYSFGGPKNPKTTWLCSILPAPKLLGTIAYLDSLLVFVFS